MQIYIVLYITISKTIISHNNFHKIYMRILFQTLSPAQWSAIDSKDKNHQKSSDRERQQQV